MNFYLASNYAVDENCEVKSYKGSPGLEVPDEVVCSPKKDLAEPGNIALMVIGVLFVASVVTIAIIKRKKK